MDRRRVCSFVYLLRDTIYDFSGNDTLELVDFPSISKITVDGEDELFKHPETQIVPTNISNNKIAFNLFIRIPSISHLVIFDTIHTS